MNPPTRKTLARKLHRLALKMLKTGMRMKYLQDSDPRIALHGRELVGAAMVAKEWADEMRRAEADLTP